MNSFLTVFALLVGVLCTGAVIAAVLKTQRYVDECHGWFLKSELTAAKLRAERDRVTVLERELDALRRQLQKLSGKFYAAQRAQEEPADSNPTAITDPLALHPYCKNWGDAQHLGPTSDAAKCKCGYCELKREQRRAFRNQQAAAGHLDPTWVKAHAGGQVDAEEN